MHHDNKYGRVWKPLIETKGDAALDEEASSAHDTCRRDVRAAAHLQQFERVAVVGHQDLERRVVHRSVIDLQRGQRFGVDEHHGQRRDEVGLWTQRNDVISKFYTKQATFYYELNTQPHADCCFALCSYCDVVIL